jgi:hypothetical protein
MGLLGVARANTAVGVSPETFLLLLQQSYLSSVQGVVIWVVDVANFHTQQKPAKHRRVSDFLDRVACLEDCVSSSVIC